jgi:hypothetical protein
MIKRMSRTASVAALGAAVVTSTVTGHAAVTVTVDNSVEYQTILG